MAAYSNTPTITWISIRGLSIQKNNKVYSVADLKTNLPFIYWETDSPNELKTSDNNLPTSSSRYLIYVNNKGEVIEVPNDDLILTYGDSQSVQVDEKLIALKEKNSENEKSISTTKQTVKNIKNQIGTWDTAKDGTLSEKITTIDQTNKKIDLSVKETNKKFDENKEMDDIRNRFNKSIIEMNTSLGLFSSGIDQIYSDNDIDQEEKNKITKLLELLNSKKDEVNIELDKIIKLANNDPVKLQSLNEDKTKFNNSINSLIKYINVSIEDRIVIPTEITTTTNLISDANTSIVSLKNNVDDFIFLGFGGSLLEEISRIQLDSNSIVLLVKENKNNTDKKFSKIDQTTSKIESTVSKKVGNDEVISSINQSAEKIVIDADKLDLVGLVTFKNLSTAGQTEIDGSNIKSKTIRAEDIMGGVFSATDEINFVGGARITKFKTYIPGTYGMFISAPSLKIQAGEWDISDSGVAEFKGLKVGKDGLDVDTDELHFGKSKYYNSHSNEYVSNITARNGNLSVAYDIWADNFNSRITGGSIGATNLDKKEYNPFDALSRFQAKIDENKKVRLITNDLFSEKSIKENQCLVKDVNNNVCLDNSSIIANLVEAVNALKKENEELRSMINS